LKIFSAAAALVAESLLPGSRENPSCRLRPSSLGQPFTARTMLVVDGIATVVDVSSERIAQTMLTTISLGLKALR
jgi:hypothetical protein